MGQPSEIRRLLADSQPQPRSAPARRDVIQSEDIHVRNYDDQWGYDLSIEAVNDDGDVAFERRYYLPPGRVESELDVLSAGKYEIHVTMDNLKHETIQCRIDSDPAHTVVTEVGNGALSLTEGLRG